MNNKITTMQAAEASSINIFHAQKEGGDVIKKYVTHNIYAFFQYINNSLLYNHI
jgi:hypothetical protein